MMLNLLGSLQNLYDRCIFHRKPQVIEQNSEDTGTYHSTSTTVRLDRFYFGYHSYTIVKMWVLRVDGWLSTETSMFFLLGTENWIGTYSKAMEKETVY